MATPEPIRDPILDRALPSSPDTERVVQIGSNHSRLGALKLKKITLSYVESGVIRH
jgi:hypothetical protein